MKVHIVKAIVFTAVTYICESWTIKKVEHQRIVSSNCGAGETPESPLDSKEIKPVNLKRNQPGILIAKTDAEVETAVFWSSNVNS